MRCSARCRPTSVRLTSTTSTAMAARKVMAQADGQFRDSVEDIANLRTRNNKGEMVPIGSMVSIGTTYGPDPVIRYNGFPAADLIGDADPRELSSTGRWAR